MKVSKDVLDVIAKSRVEGNNLYLPDVQLDRKLYVSVNKILEDLGGQWNRKSKSHVFPLHIDPSETLDEIINTGEWIDKKKEFQFFETPDEIVEQMMDLAEIKNGMKVLEPSFGKGRILLHLTQETELVWGVELNVENMNYVLENIKGLQGYILHDFLDITSVPDLPEFDRVVMNPPFSNGKDVKHIFQAWDLLAKDGILVSIVSESPFFRENKLSVEFRKWLKENNAEVIDLEAGAFKSSGTMVKTRIIKVKKG